MALLAAVSAETVVVASLKAVPTENKAQQGETQTIEVSFTPSRPATGLSQEIFGTVSLTETCYGEIGHLDGRRVQFVHDQLLCRLLEDILTELREQRELRNSEKGA